jgi:hypothetical protein
MERENGLGIEAWNPTGAPGNMAWAKTLFAGPGQLGYNIKVFGNAGGV